MPTEKSVTLANFLYVAGHSRYGSTDGSAYGFVLRDETGQPLRQGSRYLAGQSYTAANYRALIAGLEAAYEFGISRLVVRTRSRALVEQMIGTRPVSARMLRPLARRAWFLSETASSIVYDLIAVEDDLAAPLADDAFASGPLVNGPPLRSGSEGANGRTG